MYQFSLQKALQCIDLPIVEIADKLDVSLSTINRLLNGKQSPTNEFIGKMYSNFGKQIFLHQ